MEQIPVASLGDLSSELALRDDRQKFESRLIEKFALRHSKRSGRAGHWITLVELEPCIAGLACELVSLKNEIRN